MRVLLLRLTILLLCIASLLGCHTDDTTDIKGSSVLRVSIEKTRTSLGEKVGNTYPVYWSEGDRIVVNGQTSGEAQIDSDKSVVANFAIGESLRFPYCVTYPYCSATTAERPAVVFPAEQSYVEGSFDKGAAPMCGYADNGQTISLRHLSTILRLPVKSTLEGVTLERVVITSSATIAGEFAVDCLEGRVSAAKGATNVVTYTVNQPLSKEKETVLHIALPAVEAGVCSVEFFDSEGGRMRATWSGGALTAGVVREVKTISYKSGDSTVLNEWKVDSDVILTPRTAYGYVRTKAGEPIKGVAVSDGFTITTTDEDGLYVIETSPDCWYIYITIPAEYEIGVNEVGLPDFYKKYVADTHEYNFTLTPLDRGKEERFALFVLGDPQVGTKSGLDRLNREAVPAIKAHAAEWQAKGVPCYGITLGDMISNNDTSDRTEWRDDVRDSFHASKTGMPVFHVMGNHDNIFFNASSPISADERSSTFELKIQREHEDMFGPVNFSFDRGDMHIISMRNVMYNRNDHCEAGLRRSFTAEQCEWIKQDLALVPKDKAVILCVHIPFLDGGGSHVDHIRNLISEYKEAHIMSGHSHLIQAIEGAKQYNIFEHNMGALCGAWWTSYMCGDGSPCGYGVFIGEGATFTDWYHIGYDSVAKNRSHQMRLYRGNATTGAAVSGGDTNLTKGFYAFNFADNVLLANVYMADSMWRVEVYEDGVYSGEMELIKYADKSYYSRPKIYRNEATTPSSDGRGFGYMVGDGGAESPYISTIPTSADIYFSGYTNGVRGFADHAFGTNSQCYHMYKYELKSRDAQVEVVATDRFGRVYRETKITNGTDYSAVAY